MNRVEGHWLSLGVSHLPLDFQFNQQLYGSQSTPLAGMHKDILPIFVADVVDASWFFAGELFEMGQQMDVFLKIWMGWAMWDNSDEEKIEIGLLFYFVWF